MNDERALTPIETLAREKARLLAEAAEKQAAAAAVDLDMADIQRLAAVAAKYNLVLASPAVSDAGQEFQSFDGTVGGLVNCYLHDARSPYHGLLFRTRENYGHFLTRVVRDLGAERVENLDSDRLNAIHGMWSANGHIAMAHGLMGSMRRLATFGATILKDRTCRELRVTLHDMQFDNAPPRNVQLTAEHADLIRAKARERGAYSMALAQAIQFECPLGQKDVIGEMLPLSEPGTSDVIYGDQKWVRGLRWSAIDENLILRHSASRGSKDVEVDLREARMVMEELARFGGRLPKSGPVIVSETTGRPYSAVQFRQLWRELADEAEIPKTVRNTDSRRAERAVNSHRKQEQASSR